MMAVKQVVLLLLLGAVVSSAETEECEVLTKHLPTAELDKILGDWVLAWAVANSSQATDVLTNTTSSHVEFRLQADNQTVTFHERNIYQTNLSSCVIFQTNLTMNADSEHLRMQTTEMSLYFDDVRQNYSQSGEIDFYSACGDCLTMTYTEKTGCYLLYYVREGFHQDMDQMKAAHNHLKKVADCLEIPTDQPYTYDGVSDFCHKKSAPEVKAEEA